MTLDERPARAARRPRPERPARRSPSDLFNHTWTLLENARPDARAGRRDDPQRPRLALPLGRGRRRTRSTSPRGEWQCSRVVRASSVAAEPALWHARRLRRRSTRRTTAAGDWDLAVRPTRRWPGHPLVGRRRRGRSAAWKAKATRGARRASPTRTTASSSRATSRRCRDGRRPTLRASTRTARRPRPMTDLKPGILLWSQARDLARDARRREARRPARLRPPLDVGPPLRDLRRPVPADLRGLVAARRPGRARRSRPGSACSSAPTRSATPGSSPRPPRRSTTSATAGRSSASAGRGWSPSTRPTASTSGPASASGSTGSTSRSARCARVLDGESVTSAPGGRYAFDDLRHQPAAGPAAPADHDRRQRREEDAADRRQLRRHVERDGPARA